MNRRISSVALFLAVSIFAASCHVFREPFTITAVSGTPQSTLIGTQFAQPLVVQVLSKSGRPVHNAAVTFTPPGSGASASTSNTTILTNAQGMANSGIVTANTTAGSYQVDATVVGVAEPAVFNLTNTARAASGLACTGGTGQSTQVSTAFTNPLGAQVVDGGGNPVSDPGVVVTFTPPAQTGASLTFAGGVNTATTNAAGLATSAAITANANAGTYNVGASATIADAPQTCNFSLTNTSVAVTSENFVFYASGYETINGGPNFYGIAGVVTIETSGPAPGTVLGGEQDYNDGAEGEDEPSITAHDSITGGLLTVDAGTGQGTLTLQTDDDNFGGFTTPAGEEEFVVQFANPNHALVTQWDDTATSSGSMDLQTSTSLPSGGFAFTLSGVDTSYFSVVLGGVFTITGNSISGTFDLNDDNTGLVTDQPLTALIPSPDGSGRGVITSTTEDTPASIAYYVVGPEAIRLIDIDEADSGVGSAFGQGDNSFSNTSLGTFAFQDVGDPWNGGTGAAGELTANSEAGTLSGVGDLNEKGEDFTAVALTASDTKYSIAANGYGSISILDGGFGDVAEYGVYMTDPKLNLNDPNNTSTGTGGALIADLTPATAGTGVITPQTSTTGFAGNYAFTAQAFDENSESELDLDELDFNGQGSVASNALNGLGYISDPFEVFDGEHKLFSGVSYTGTATPDGSNPGRYFMSTTPLLITPSGEEGVDFTVAIYEAGPGQLFMVDQDDFAAFTGPIEQQAANVSPLPSAKVKAQTKPTQKK